MTQLNEPDKTPVIRYDDEAGLRIRPGVSCRLTMPASLLQHLVAHKLDTTMVQLQEIEAGSINFQAQYDPTNPTTPFTLWIEAVAWVSTGDEQGKRFVLKGAQGRAVAHHAAMLEAAIDTLVYAINSLQLDSYAARSRASPTGDHLDFGERRPDAFDNGVA